MTYQPHYIAAFDENSGLQNYNEAFLLPEKSYPILEDAYVWRGMTRKRKGFTHLGRLRRILTLVNIPNIQSGAGPFPATVSINVFTTMGILPTEPYAELQKGSATEPLVINIAGGITLTDVTGTGILVPAGTALIDSATINYSTGVLTVVFNAAFGPLAATITGSYYPSLPVMGLRSRENDGVNEEDLIAFDTKYAYFFILAFQELSPSPATVWHGTDHDFFWTTNYYIDTRAADPLNPSYGNGKKLFWATNFNLGVDPIRINNTVVWSDFIPILTADNAATPTKLYGCRLLIPYKNRLIAMNTWEGGTQGTSVAHPNRIRFSQNGTPLTIGVVAAGPKWTTVGSWASDIPGYGGWIDLPTQENIVSAAFVKDTILVKCERSSYKLIYTGIPSIPFTFEKINSEMGCESTFSPVQFDEGVLTVGNNAITGDDSVSVSRIDESIPNFIFTINNDKFGTYRVYGIRNFVDELVFWCYPDNSDNINFPNKILVYNYKNKSFSIFNDSFTCFGYFQQTVDKTWDQLPYSSWDEWTDPWNNGSAQSYHLNILGGNQQGYVSTLFNNSINGISLSIRAITPIFDPITFLANGAAQFTVINHNLASGTIVKVLDVICDPDPSVPDYTTINNINYIVRVIDEDTITLQTHASPSAPYVDVMFDDGGTYYGGGHLIVKNNFNITTKVFAPFYEQDGQVRLGYIDYFIGKTTYGEVTADVFIDEANGMSQTSPIINSGNMGSNILLTRPENTTLIPYQTLQSKIWHRQFVQSICQNFQIKLSMSEQQMLSENICNQDFVLHAIAFYITKNARLVQ